MPSANKTLRKLPSVDSVLLQADVKALLSRFPREVVVEGVRQVLDAKRSVLRSGKRAGTQVTGRDVEDALSRWMQPAMSMSVRTETAAFRSSPAVGHPC